MGTQKKHLDETVLLSSQNMLKLMIREHYHFYVLCRPMLIYSEPCLKWPLKIDKTKVLMTSGSLMHVKSIAECSTRAFCNTFDLHKVIISLENIFLGHFMNDHLRPVLLLWTNHHNLWYLLSTLSYKMYRLVCTFPVGIKQKLVFSSS